MTKEGVRFLLLLEGPGKSGTSEEQTPTRDKSAQIAGVTPTAGAPVIRDESLPVMDPPHPVPPLTTSRLLSLLLASSTDLS